jgi:hypothetical protein
MTPAIAQSSKVVHIARGPLDEPGFTFTSTGLIIDPGVPFDQWARYGRKLQLADKGIQWALGDWVTYGDAHFKERAAQAVEFSGLKIKTLQNYATVAKAVTKSRRRDSDLVDFATHSEVAMLPEDEQERILAQAEADPEFTRQRARKEAKRAKRRLNLIPDEVVLIHTAAVQEYLGSYIEGLQMMDQGVPAEASFLHGMIQAHIGQAQWQKDRTTNSDFGAILDTFDEAYTQTDQDIYKRMIVSGHFVSDPDLDDRLETMSLHSVLTQQAEKAREQDKTRPHHRYECHCTPDNKQLQRVPPGGKQDARRGDMGPDLYMLYDQSTGEAANVPRAQSRYSSGERE